MTSVTGITKAEADEIEANSVIDAFTTSSGEIILVTKGGANVNLGALGAFIRKATQGIGVVRPYGQSPYEVAIPEWIKNGASGPVGLSGTNATYNVGTSGTGGFALHPDCTTIMLPSNVSGNVIYTLVRYAYEASIEAGTAMLVTPPANLANLAISPDGIYVIGCAAGAVTLWRITGIASGQYTTTKPGVSITAPTGTGRMYWGPYGRLFALADASTTAGAINVWKFDSSTYGATRLTVPTDSARQQGLCDRLAWSNSGKYIVNAMRKNTATEVERLQAYSIDGETITYLPNTTFDSLPVTTVNDLAFSPDDKYLAAVTDVASNSDSGLYIYKRTGATFAKLANPSTVPTNSGTSGPKSCLFSADGRYLLVSDWSSSFMRIYEINSLTDTFTLVSCTMTPIPTAPFTEMKFSNDGSWLWAYVSGTMYVYGAGAPSKRQYDAYLEKVTPLE